MSEEERVLVFEKEPTDPAASLEWRIGRALLELEQRMLERFVSLAAHVGVERTDRIVEVATETTARDSATIIAKYLPGLGEVQTRAAERRGEELDRLLDQPPDDD